MSNDLMRKALEYGRKKHNGQKRWGGQDYFENHCVVVAQYVSENYEDLFPPINNGMMKWRKTMFYNYVICGALLHDTLEDTDATHAEIANEFSPLVADIVNALTKKEGQSYCDYIKSIFDCGAIFVPVRAIKTADLICNLSDLKKGSLRDKYELSLEFLWFKK